MGAYEHTSREISLLSDAQKSALGSLGTTVAIGLQGSLATYAQMLPAAMQQQLGTDLGQAATALNGAGEHLVDALRTDTRNLWANARPRSTGWIRLTGRWCRWNTSSGWLRVTYSW